MFLSVCFKIFDNDRDGILNKKELQIMSECLIEVSKQTQKSENLSTPKKLMEEIVAKHDGKDQLTLEEYLVWTVDNPYPREFSQLVFDMCHVVFGLRPLTRRDEGSIVRGWLMREKSCPLVPGAIWHILNMDWWNNWNKYVDYQVRN